MANHSARRAIARAPKTAPPVPALGPIDRRILEDLVDASSLSRVIDALADIANDKAIHIEEDWPATDSGSLVRLWNAAADRLRAAVDHITV